MPRALTVLAFMVLFALLCGLGVWQLSRANEKQARFEQFSERLAARPVDLDVLAGDLSEQAMRWRRVEIAGAYLETRFLLDNRIREGIAGYEVLAPFRSAGGRHVLVNRGWLAAGGRRDAVPDVVSLPGMQRASGYLGPPPVVGIELAGEGSAVESLGSSLFRIQRPHLGGLAKHLGVDLWPAVLYLDPGAPGALDADWPVPGDGSDRHRAYAVQWFAMAAVLALIGIFNLRSRAGETRET